MAISIISSVQSMARKLAAAIHGSQSSSSSDLVLSSMKTDLESMERTLRRIQTVLNDAEEREIRDNFVKLWLKELRWVAYDAENILGEYQYEVRGAKIISSAAETSLKRKRQDDQVYEPISVLLQLCIPQRIRDIMERFEEISKAQKDLQLKEEDGPRRHYISHVPQPSSSLVDEFGIFGRENDQEAVIQMLLSDKVSSKISVISIVGMGGLGKTTLAQCVYNDPRVHQYFDSRGWVCVSEDFDVKRLTGEIIQSITKKPCGLTQSDALQTTLKEILDGKKVLLVLDDVWNEKQDLWKSLRTPFISATSIRVLVTTRNDSVAKTMQTMNMYRLGYLPVGKCWSLFCHHAFSDQNPDNYPHLVEVGRKIVQKCGGLPLAVKTLGSFLLHYETDEERWREVSESDIWELDGAKDDILPALKLSYYRMPSHLKPCFLFTSLYPKDFQFCKPRLIKMWMAHGYILPRGNKRLEDIGNEYFDELQTRSLILHYNPEKYVLHDVIHDLARHVSENEHHSIVLESDGKVCHIPAEVRHLFVKCQQGATLAQVPLESRDLRTLIVNQDYYGNSFMVNDPHFEHLGHLRVLEVNCRRLTSSIGNLKHLRYLDCKKSDFNDSLSSLNHLYNMQTLSLRCDYNYLQLVGIMRCLSNLRHLNLEINVSRSECILPSMLSDLTWKGICYSTYPKLVEITLSGTTAKWVSFIPFSQLPSLRYLRVTSMFYINHVGHEDYCYCPVHLGNVRKSVITNSVGFPCLEELVFENMSNWKEWSGVMDGDFRCLSRIILRSCPLLRGLPMLPPSLQSLHIFKCDSLKSLPINNGQVRFPFMEELVFEDLREWEDWTGVDSQDFPFLRRLTIKSCHKLRRLPILPSSLQSLHISACHSLTSLPINHGHVKFPCMEKLVFEDMVAWEEWPGVNSRDFPCLHKLTITRCYKLRRLPMLSSSLQSLRIYNCHRLKFLLINHGQVRFPYMEELVFGYMSEWEEWSDVDIGDFPPLRKLAITRCHKLRTLPMLPSSLHSLHISACHSLKYLPIDKNHGHVRFPFLKEMIFEDIPDLEEEWLGISDGDFPCLCKLTIKHCQKLQGFPMLSSSLKVLTIRSWWSLTSLAGLQNLISLERLTLERCPKLRIPPEEVLPSKPQHVKIVDCPSLQEWCHGHQFNCIQESYGLTELTLYHSQRIIHDLGIDNLTSLKRLKLQVPETHLSSDECLPPMIRILEVNSCINLQSLSLWQNLLLLKRLDVRSCPVLTSVDGLHNLPNLETLSFGSCPKLQLSPDNSLPSSLQSLKVVDCKGLRSLPLLHEKLSSLKELEVFNCPELTIVEGLHNLSSLKVLIVMQCPGLWLSPDEQIPSMPHHVFIAHCPALRGWCRQQNIPYNQCRNHEKKTKEEMDNGKGKHIRIA